MLLRGLNLFLQSARQVFSCFLRFSTDGVALLHIGVPALAVACTEFVTRNGARTFATFDEFDQVFHARREVKVRKVDDVA